MKILNILFSDITPIYRESELKYHITNLWYITVEKELPKKKNSEGV